MAAGMPLRALLDATERRGPLILTNSYGRPWTSDGFSTSWSKTCARPGTALTFHDLRGSAVVRLALAEATVPIATFTGHSVKDVEAILSQILRTKVRIGMRQCACSRRPADFYAGLRHHPLVWRWWFSRGVGSNKDATTATATAPRRARDQTGKITRNKN